MPLNFISLPCNSQVVSSNHSSCSSTSSVSSSSSSSSSASLGYAAAYHPDAPMDTGAAYPRLEHGLYAPHHSAPPHSLHAAAPHHSGYELTCASAATYGAYAFSVDEYKPAISQMGL